MAKKKKLHGIAKAEKINAQRSNRAKKADARKSSKHTYKKATEKNIDKWSKKPSRSDIKSIDTKTKRKPAKKKK